MRDYRIRLDLKRAEIDGFAFPLGIEPPQMPRPREGYSVAFTPGEEETPDAYSFHIVASHEKLRPLIQRAFDLLPSEVSAIVEASSLDAYRTMDVFMSAEPISYEEFLSVWTDYEPFFLEDASVAVGANSDDPFVEVFVDTWKSVSIHIPPSRQAEVEEMLNDLGLRELPDIESDFDNDEVGDAVVRPVLEVVDEFSTDIDEVLLQLRRAWMLELNIDPESNTDDAGRELGLTLWRAVLIVDKVDDEEQGAYLTVWATASSLAQLEQMVEDGLSDDDEWQMSEVYAVERVAYDERPEELNDIPPRQTDAKIHMMTFDLWDESTAPPEEDNGAA